MFQTVTREVGILCGADLARMERYESGDSVIGVAGWSRGGAPGLAVGTRFSLEPASIAATVELRELAHGILPAVLTRGGLRAGVDALASRMPLPVENDVSVGRLRAVVEATAYFVVAEALTNVAKHARATRVTVTACVEDSILQVRVRDDGVGGALPHGSGLLGLADRLAVLDGQLQVESPINGGTLVAQTSASPASRRVRKSCGLWEGMRAGVRNYVSCRGSVPSRLSSRSPSGWSLSVGRAWSRCRFGRCSGRG